MTQNPNTNPVVDYQTHPDQYRHVRLRVEGPIATLALDIDEDGGLRPGYKLKLNSYDLGVDIELHDALNRIRFEHPQVRTVVVTSLKDRVFCSGANIFMLGLSSHAWKVNFCKFTNETRNGMEDSSRHEGIKFLAALNGACAGGGYELALACDDIVLVDDRSSAVSLPEVPLLGVLPGTGGLTRLTDKRRVRHDLADVLCTSVEGVRGQRAVDWRLVDAIAKPAVFAQTVRERAERLAAQSDRPANAQGVPLPPLQRTFGPNGVTYRYVRVAIDRVRRVATLTVHAPDTAQPADLAGIVAAGAARPRAGRGRSGGARAGDRGAGRHRLGRRDPPRAGGACRDVAGRPHRTGGKSALRRARDDAHPHLRSPVGVAELDFPAPQCGR